MKIAEEKSLRQAAEDTVADLAARLAAADEARTIAAIKITDQKTAFWEEQVEKEALREELNNLNAARGAERQEDNSG